MHSSGAATRSGPRRAAKSSSWVAFRRGKATARLPRCRSPRRWKTMTNLGGAQAARRGRAAGKSLKEQNRWQLWIIVAVNSLFMYGVVQANAIGTDGLRAALTDAQNLIPVGL